ERVEPDAVHPTLERHGDGEDEQADRGNLHAAAAVAGERHREPDADLRGRCREDRRAELGVVDVERTLDVGRERAGQPIVEAGDDVAVASRSRAPIDAALAFGATEGDGPRGVVAASDVTILCVPNSPEVVEVIDAAVPALRDGKIVVDTSTIDPDVERAQH